MTTQRVRVGQVFAWKPVLLDKLDARLAGIEEGLFLKVINLRGCPPANTMGHCYVETMTGDFIGLVHCNSLQKLDAKLRRQVKRLMK